MSWILSSKSDKRWNIGGKGNSESIGWLSIPEAKRAFDKLLKKYGEAPKDLEFILIEDG